MATLAYVFHFQPSEIGALEVEDFARWIEQADLILAPPKRER
jgi:hypothetical protein